MSGQLAEKLLAVLFPNSCVLCRQAVEYDDLVCGKCPIDRPKRPVLEGRHDTCWHFSAAIAPLAYTGNVRKAVISMKLKQDKRLCRFFTGEMHALLQREYGHLAFDRIVEVPQSKVNLKKRRFNQAALLAQRLQQLTGVVWEPDVLRRSGDSLPQHNLGYLERVENAARSYSIALPEKADGAVILLVDDVFTTGATVNACADSLVRAGAKAVFVLTATATQNDR